jgi:L-rhamnose 1-dehydrogenase
MLFGGVDVKLLQGKTVVVTGASTGIGRAIAIGAARHGADVAINYARDTAGAEACIAGIEAVGQRGIAVQGDVADPATAADFIGHAVEAFGKVDVMVSNAGICPFHSFLDMPVETLERTMRVNLHGGYFMCQAAANQMVRQGDGGSIIAVSSISALVGGEFQTHYTPTKAGLHSLMQSAAIALGRYNIRCNSLLPGTILTEINKDDLADQTKRDYMAGRVPLGRLGEPEDMVGPAVFLASDMAGYVTGASLLVDGGAYVNLQ